ncbi:MAG: NAD(+) synthase [Anaerofustis stercorihominis]|nr:NAD(+) synthase [Anaerofustis stercorihominis]
MLRDYEKELQLRVEYIREMLKNANSKGIVFGNSGGKDSALVGILCKKACENTTGIIMPCQSRRNYEEDTVDAMEVADKFGIKTLTVDITNAKEAISSELSKVTELSQMASANINPRLRMITLYAYAHANNLLVAGTGNRSETYVGYFTKWGDGGFDFNPIRDLTVTEVYEFLEYLDAPLCVRTKAPSAALFDGQTDEKEMGMTYAQIDEYLFNGPDNLPKEIVEKIERMHRNSQHKMTMPSEYKAK